jgi:hypothetical protein
MFMGKCEQNYTMPYLFESAMNNVPTEWFLRIVLKMDKAERTKILNSISNK